MNLLATDFPSFADVSTYEEVPVRLLKRAQIFVADVWACFGGEGYGAFDDIGELTAFADYRIPQMLCTLGCLGYSPALEGRVRRVEVLEAGGEWEVEIRGGFLSPLPSSSSSFLLVSWSCLCFGGREMTKEVEGKTLTESSGCSIWAVELIKREIRREHPETHVNAVLLDFYMYDCVKELEAAGGDMMPHHRTRSIWY